MQLFFCLIIVPEQNPFFKVVNIQKENFRRRSRRRREDHRNMRALTLLFNGEK